LHIDADDWCSPIYQEDIVTEFIAQLSSSADRVLLHELNHRTNNEFAAAIGGVSLAAARSSNDDVKAALTAVGQLLQHYAYVHRALQIPEHDTLVDAANYLRQLCLSITQSHLAYRRIKLVLATEPLQLQADPCWRLGMIVYELIINAARHAFQHGQGEIGVQLIDTGAVAQCTVVDNGSAPASIGPGRGLKIIDELTKSLGGRFESKLGPRGSSSTLIFPFAGTPKPSSGEGIQECTGDCARTFLAEAHGDSLIRARDDTAWAPVP
jgi:two-component sensor histidine kinase